MRSLSSRPQRRAFPTRSPVMLVAAVTTLSLAPWVSSPAAVAGPGAGSGVGRAVSYHGVAMQVPDDWRIVDLAADPHACLRFDTPTVYFGPAGDQAECPAHLVGGAPGLHLEPLTGHATAAVAGGVLTVPPTVRLSTLRLPRTGPVGVAVQRAGLLMTLVYGPGTAPAMQRIVAGTAVHAHGRLANEPPDGRTVPAVRVTVPGDYSGAGFDTCAAPDQAVMDAWQASSGYASLGIYIGGVDQGCDQPNLTAAWVARQVARGWHLVPVYVGHQAPCTDFANRMSYNVATAHAQGQADALDAIARATMRGIVAPSTVYSDVEGYDSTSPSCVAAVMSYLTGWTFALHAHAYDAGVYSSASSGMHDLSVHYDTLGGNRPDDLFMAWWNHRVDVDGGSFVPTSQWSDHQRVHQYEGQQNESHGGYTLLVDRNYLDVSSSVSDPSGCPTGLDFPAYPLLRWPTRGDQVRAAQCLLARNGFDPGPATGVLDWRTAAAIRGFKASRALRSDDATVAKWAWTALLAGGGTPPLHLGCTGPWVRKLQRTLTARLRTTVTIDGTFGASTQAAVRAYQRSVGLTPTGTVGPPTWHSLQSGL